MAGSATFTTDVFSTTRNCAAASRRRVAPRRRVCGEWVRARMKAFRTADRTGACPVGRVHAGASGGGAVTMLFRSAGGAQTGSGAHYCPLMLMVVAEADRRRP
ncbi:hypothetical protein GCM10010251_39000 [Streptomyces aurantiogriseus]|uniref:Uncharacterized protein n=1 Tax=Streptomyces aurantiogriseus TaxID=66870 RepID=A0A918CFR3_9ACTN|nr:hypothetical protein GCM10010251_39000 [Streptomyces aurantiogriseus]